MEYEEFADLADSLMERLRDRLSPGAHGILADALSAGETEFGVEELAASLLKRQVPVSPSERDDLVALWTDMGRPADELDGLHVVSETS